MSLEVANEIRRQIGARALFMMGAKNMIGDEKSLTFKIYGSPSVSHVRITLDASDTYTVECLKIRGFNAPKTVSSDSYVHCDNLHSMLSIRTGLALSL